MGRAKVARTWRVDVLADDVPGVLVEALAGGHPSVYARVTQGLVVVRDGTRPYYDRYGWHATPEGVRAAVARVDAILAASADRGLILTRRAPRETAAAFGVRHRAAVRAQKGGAP